MAAQNRIGTCREQKVIRSVESLCVFTIIYDFILALFAKQFIVQIKRFFLQFQTYNTVFEVKNACLSLFLCLSEGMCSLLTVFLFLFRLSVCLHLPLSLSPKITFRLRKGIYG